MCGVGWVDGHGIAIAEVALAIRQGLYLKAFAVANSGRLPIRYVSCSELEEFVKPYREHGSRLGECCGCVAYQADGVLILVCGNTVIVVASRFTGYVLRCSNH